MLSENGNFQDSPNRKEVFQPPFLRVELLNFWVCAYDCLRKKKGTQKIVCPMKLSEGMIINEFGKSLPILPIQHQCHMSSLLTKKLVYVMSPTYRSLKKPWGNPLVFVEPPKFHVQIWLFEICHQKIPGPSCSYHQCCISKTSSGVGFRFTFQECILGMTKKETCFAWLNLGWHGKIKLYPVDIWGGISFCFFFPGSNARKNARNMAMRMLYHLVRKIISISESLSTLTLRCDGVSIPNEPYLEPGLHLHDLSYLHIYTIWRDIFPKTQKQPHNPAAKQNPTRPRFSWYSPFPANKKHYPVMLEILASL